MNMKRRDINVLLIVIDTLRRDHLGCYGYFRDTSPNIDRLAKEGVIFKDMHATAIATGPGFSSIISGLSPIHHHFYLTPWDSPNLIDFDDSIPTLPMLIQKGREDYTTCALDNLMNFASPMDQFVRGFEYYINVDRMGKERQFVRGDRINHRLIPWLEAHREENFFLFLHYWEPHTPYNQPAEFREIFHYQGEKSLEEVTKEAPAGYKYVPGWGKMGEIVNPGGEDLSIELYDGEIRYVDHLIGEVIDTLERLDILRKSVIIITSDHGEQLGHHGSWLHDKVVESVIQVPLIMWGPGVLPSGKVVKGYVQQADIAPTILSLLGIEQLPYFDGKSLLPLIEGKEEGRKEIIVEDHIYRCLISGEWKYIRNYFSGEEELYNLSMDPMESINLAGKEKERLKEMRVKLNEWVRENLKGELDPMWEQMARWSAVWNARYGTDFPHFLPRPALAKEK